MCNESKRHLTLKAAEELLSVGNGAATAQDVLFHAQGDNPLRVYFEWDDKIAAHQYRLLQARSMLAVISGPWLVNLPQDLKTKRAFTNRLVREILRPDIVTILPPKLGPHAKRIRKEM